MDEISEARSSVGQGEIKPPKIIKSDKKKVTNHPSRKGGNRPLKNQHLGIKCMLCGEHPIDPKAHNCIDNAEKDENIMKQIERLLRRN